MAGEDAAVVLSGEPGEELARELAEIYIGAGIDPGGSDRFGCAAVDEERSPAAENFALRGKLHRAEKRMRREGSVSGAEEGDMGRAADKAEVRHDADEVGRARGEAVSDSVTPKL